MCAPLVYAYKYIHALSVAVDGNHIIIQTDPIYDDDDDGISTPPAKVQRHAHEKCYTYYTLVLRLYPQSRVINDRSCT